MCASSKPALILSLLLGLSACLPARQINLPTASISASGTPSISVTPTLLLAAPAPVPPIAELYMLDAENGWAWTSSQRLLRTADGGRTWLDRTPAGQVWSDGFFFLDAQTAWLPVYIKENNRFALRHTTDGGQTWTEYPYGPPSGLHFSDALNGWAVSADMGAGNVYYSLTETHDGGKTWAPIPVTPPEPESGLPPGTIHLCSMCADIFYYDPRRMVIVYGDMITMQPGGSLRMVVSFDLGRNWQKRNLPLPPGSPEALVSPYRPVFFAEQEGLLPVSLVKMDSSGNYVYQRLVFYVTHDGGASWQVLAGILENIPPFAQVQAISLKDIYVLCDNALCASHDGAQTWAKVPSNLDLSQTDKRSVWLLQFLDASTAWASVMENDITTLYKTTDGGRTWNALAPLLVSSTPPVISIDNSIPTPTLLPTPTIASSPTPDVTFDRNANAYRIRFAPYGTWIETSDKLPANGSRRYVLSAVQGQVMSIAVVQGPTFQVGVTGADGKPLGDSQPLQPFWRGRLPSTQDYYVSVSSRSGGPFSLRIAINPLGQDTQNFWFVDPQYLAMLNYTDEFAPTSLPVPVNLKGSSLITLAFIDSSFYHKTNLEEAYLQLAASADPAVVASCTQPSTQVSETITGQENTNSHTFTRSQYSGAAAGNRYDYVIYRTAWQDKCFEVVFMIHSTNLGNYPAGTVVAYDRAGLLREFEAVLDIFSVK